MAQFILPLAFLLSSILATFVWLENKNLSLHTPELIAFLILLYLLNHLSSFKKLRLNLALNSFILSFVTLLFVSQTGGLASPLFFLLFILLFGLSLLLTPLTTLVFSLSLCLFFWRQIASLNNLLQLTGLLLMTPLALFFGRQYLKILESEEKIKILRKKREQLSQEVSQQEKDTLLWLSLAFKEQVIKILDISSNLLTDLGHLTFAQKEDLQKIHENAKKLLGLGEQLKEKIEG